MRIIWLLATTLLAAPAIAADEPTPRISVSGTGSVKTPPDLAVVAFSVRGEGTTSDQAVAQLVARRQKISAGLTGFAARNDVKASRVAVNEVRGRDCQQYGPPRLSVSECAVLGYVAELTMELRTADPARAGTIVGLIGRLEGTSPRIERFALANPKDAERRAIGAALVDARGKADAIAQGMNVRLGAVILATNANYGRVFEQDIIVTGSSVPAPPPPPPPPIAIDLTPQPIETQANVMVTYAIAP